MQIDNTENVIDSRDIIDRIEELEALRADAGLVADDDEELRVLLELAEQCEDSPDWTYGESLIRDSFFTDYTHSLVEECCDAPSSIPMLGWPWNVNGAITIDWNIIAESAKQDYTCVNYDGVEYWIRS